MAVEDIVGGVKYTGEDAKAFLRLLQGGGDDGSEEGDPPKKKKVDLTEAGLKKMEAERVKNAPKLKEITSWWEKALSFLNGGRDYDGINYDDDGNPTGLSLRKIELPFYVIGPGSLARGVTVLGKYPSI